VAVRLGDIKAGEPHILRPAALEAAFKSLPLSEQQLLERVAGRIRAFAQAQRDSAEITRIRVTQGELAAVIATVEAHRANIMEKLNANTVADLLKTALGQNAAKA
jgi:FixJ family two-component response regulator